MDSDDTPQSSSGRHGTPSVAPKTPIEQFLSFHKRELESLATQYSTWDLDLNANMSDHLQGWESIQMLLDKLTQKTFSLSAAETDARWLPLLREQTMGFNVRVMEVFNGGGRRDSWFMKNPDGGWQLLHQTLHDILTWISGQASALSKLKCLVSV